MPEVFRRPRPSSLSAILLTDKGIGFGAAFGFFGNGFTQQFVNGNTAARGFFFRILFYLTVHVRLYLTAQTVAFFAAFRAKALQFLIFEMVKALFFEFFLQFRILSALIDFRMVKQQNHRQKVEIFGGLFIVPITKRTVRQSIGVFKQLPALGGKLFICRRIGWRTGLILGGGRSGQTGEQQRKYKGFFHMGTFKKQMGKS